MVSQILEQSPSCETWIFTSIAEQVGSTDAEADADEETSEELCTVEDARTDEEELGTSELMEGATEMLEETSELEAIEDEDTRSLDAEELEDGTAVEETRSLVDGIAESLDADGVAEMIEEEEMAKSLDTEVATGTVDDA